MWLNGNWGGVAPVETTSFSPSLTETKPAVPILDNLKWTPCLVKLYKSLGLLFRRCQFKTLLPLEMPTRPEQKLRHFGQTKLIIIMGLPSMNRPGYRQIFFAF